MMSNTQYKKVIRNFSHMLGIVGNHLIIKRRKDKLDKIVVTKNPAAFLLATAVLLNK